MTARHLVCPMFAVAIFCSHCPAAPPEGKDRDPKEPGKGAKVEGKPVLVPLWKKTTVGLEKGEDLRADEHAPGVKWLTKLYESFREDAQRNSRAVIPPGVPIVRKGQVVYLTDEYIVARALTEHRIFDDQFDPGDLLYQHESDSGLIGSSRHLGGRSILDRWLDQKGSTLTDRIMHRTLSYSLGEFNGRYVYLDNIPLLPTPSPKGALPAGHGSLTPAIWNSFLKEVDSESGKLLAKAIPDFAAFGAGFRKKDEVRPTHHFLSLPLIRDRAWFAVREEAGVLALRGIDWEKYTKTYLRDVWRTARKAFADARLWEAELAKPPVPLPDDSHRRTHAIHLVQSGDLILSPTHLGRVLAVDSKTGKIAWTHEYAPLDAKRFPTFAPEWVVVPPIVVGDKYIYAPADFPELLCLNVADGKKVWSIKKGDGLYPAVVGEEVLVVGEKTLRSLNLKDGSERWKLDLPGLPCGRGAMLGETYLLPVSEPKTWRGMIAVVDVKNGKITEVLKPEKDEPIGNLVVHKEFLISQTLTEIAVFPIK